MAEDKEVVIRIINDKTNDKQKQVQNAEIDIYDTATISYLERQTKAFLKSVTTSEVKYQLNKYYRLTDDYLGYAYEIIATDNSEIHPEVFEEELVEENKGENK